MMVNHTVNDQGQPTGSMQPSWGIRPAMLNYKRVFTRKCSFRKITRKWSFRKIFYSKCLPPSLRPALTPAGYLKICKALANKHADVTWRVATSRSISRSMASSQWLVIGFPFTIIHLLSDTDTVYPKFCSKLIYHLGIELPLIVDTTRLSNG